jgi:cell division protein FtsQ
MADMTRPLIAEMQKAPTVSDLAERRKRNRVILKSVLAVLGTIDVIMGLLLLYLFFLHVPYFNLRQVDVTGNHRLSQTEVVEAAEIEAGTNLLTVDLGTLAAGLRRHPWIREASVYRRFPGQLIIEIEERAPRAILATEKLYYVDEQGAIFTRLLPGDSVEYPLFTGPTSAELEKSGPEVQEMVRLGLGLLDLLDRKGSVLNPNAIADIRIDLDDGLSLHLRSGKVLIVGKADFELKMQRYGRLKRYLIQSGQWNNAGIINLDFEDRALVRSTDKPGLQG